MDVKEAGASLDSLISHFSSRITELQQFVIARNMYPASSISDLSGIDAALKGMELQVQNIKDRLRDEAQAIPKAKEKKGRASPPVWYITGDELNSLPSYMKQRLTLDKVNAAIGDMITYAEANAQLITAPRKKLTENNLDRALELRDISMMDAVKGKHFFLESDVKRPAMKLDNTGKAILTVLRHLGRISETRVGHHRVIILLRPR